jgi:hypothetical protein
MNNDQYSVFFKAMMTGLFIGIIDTLICLAYNIGYRDITGYLPSSLINVSSLIFAVNILLTVVGIVFYVFLRFFKKGAAVYTLVLLVLTAWLTWRSMEIVRFSDARLDGGFHGLLGGIVLILGISSASLPFFYHSKKFQEAII